MIKKLPKIIFKQMPVRLETEMFFDFLEGDWSGMITEKYPGFAKIQNVKPKKERARLIKKEIVKIRAGLGERLNGDLNKIKSDWQKVEKKVLQTIAEIVQVDWTARKITAYVSLNPICPRYLDSLSFVVTYDRDQANKVIAHEISHFLFFKKFKQVFPKIDKKKYESPHKEWILSEIVAVIILNDKRITQVLDSHSNGYYPQHRDFKIDNKPLTEIVENLYEEFVVQKNNFSEFIRKSMEVLKGL
jgi:hypothetical protein